MKLLLILSVFTSIEGIRVPSIWEQQQNDNANLNNANRDIRPINQAYTVAPQIQTIAQPGPSYNSNPFINNLPSTATNSLINNGNTYSNIPIDYNNFFTVGVPNNGFSFIPSANQISNGNLLSSNINSLANNGSGRRPKPYTQQRPGPPKLTQNQWNYNRRPVASINSGSASYTETPGQVPYITYTQGQVPHTAALNAQNPAQKSDQSVNIKQAYPQVSSPKTVLPLTELDFSPRNPFPHNQEEGQASTQVNSQNTLFSTSQPINNLDFSLYNLFPVSDFQVTQLPQTPQIQSNRQFPVRSNNENSNYNPSTNTRNSDFNPFKKNYRDHRTQEPTEYDPHYDREAVPIVERLESEKAPIVKNHEHPPEVPTRPIYPGEGQWAKPGYKHRPFVSPQQYSNLEESNEQPDGYDTFLEGQKLFENQKRQFGQKLQSPGNDNGPTHQSSTEENANEGEIFVPTRLYAQVRHSEDEKHLPPESDENGRLKELIKDTKIQTIYSEEGFEDSAYDHAGHEKKAENVEDFESDEKDKESKKKKIKEHVENFKGNELNLENETEGNDDSEPAGTHYEEQSYLNKIKPSRTKEEDKKSFAKSKETKTVIAKDKGGGKIEMEISSVVKAVVQPNNSTKFHKYVKIYPKISKNVTAEDSSPENENLIPKEQVKLDADRRSLLVNPHEIFIEEITNHTKDISSTEYVSTTATPTEYTDIVTMEIPTTTQPTTALPKLETKNEVTSIKNINKVAMKLKLRRRKRAAPTIEIDTDFIDKINHDLGKPTEKSNKPIENKYPYYKRYAENGLHEDSPLRYAEDLKNVPVKTKGKLAFYELADRKMVCPDVNPEVDPVPDRIKNADEGVEEEEEDEEGNDPAAKEPRLGQLGDRIDCFKLKYFGENPLDNPLFQEKSVGAIKPIFSEIENISTKKIGEGKIGTVSQGSTSKNAKRELKPPNAKNGKEFLLTAASSLDTENEIDDGISHKYSLTSWFPGKNFGIGENTERDSKFVNHFVEKNPNFKTNVEIQTKQTDIDNIKAQHSKNSAKEVQTLPPATLITTPKYTIQLKPKHIYDQIELLEYLPDEELDELKKELNADLPKNNLSEITTSSPNTNKTETALNKPITKKKKKSKKKNAGRKSKALKSIEESMKMETSDNRNPESLPESDALQLVRPKLKKPLYEIFDINKFLPKVPKIPFPTAPAKRVSTVKNLAPVSIINPTYEIFDINKYLPTTPFPLLQDFMTRGTIIPKYKVISEVFYKEDIKPNEQLNVFTDVLNNIRNFPRLKDNFPESSAPISVKLNAEKVTEKHPQNLLQQTLSNDKDYFSSTITTIMTTFDPKIYASNHKYLDTKDTEKQIENMLNEYKSGKKPKRRRRVKTTTQETPMVIEESTSTVQYIGEPTEVMGLMPPAIQGYKTIYHPKRDNSQYTANPTIRIEERKINKYFVQGMRPPPKQKVFLYSDFITDNHITQRMSRPKRNKPRRSKRSAQRPAYAQVSRNRNKQPQSEPETKKEEDDYVPHRNRNYHYDEKTGKIVYDKKPQEQSEEEEEEVEYIEVVEETPKTTAKPKQNPIFATATPPPKGQSYTDFVKLLKSASNYHEIPDPTTTEKGAEEITEKLAASTLHPVSTSPPEFLSILAKVRNDTTYKLIDDKKKTTTIISVPAEDEEVETVEEESQVEDVRNSPGGQGYEAGANLEIFDITDFLPNIKNYLPKTSVDTSKYKTIERPHLRHSYSSRYNSEEDKDLQNVNTSKQPILTNTEKARGPKRGQIREQAQVRSTSPIPEVISPKIVRNPTRRRTTTARPVPDQDDASTTQTTLTTQESTAASNDKSKRNYRRRPKRIKVTPTTENNLETESDNKTKVIHRRTERESHMQAEGNEKYEEVVESSVDEPKPLIRKDDYVDYEDVSDNSNNTNTKQLGTISLLAKEVVEVFKNYDKNQKHGGNYKKEDEVKKDNLKQVEIAPTEENLNATKAFVEVFKAYDKTKKHGGNYRAENEELAKVKDPMKPIPAKEPKDIKKVETLKDYDKTKKHGGNYKPASEDVTINEQDESGLEKTESIKIENVNIFQDYDKTKKHGGNYKSAPDTSEENKANVQSEKPELLKNVDLFKDYDKTKKHGGNYKSGTGTSEENKANAQSEKPELLKNVEVFKDYDKTKKHGGNYRPQKNAQIQELQLDESQFISPHAKQNLFNENSEQKASAEIFKDYDKTKRHGGNYIRENEKVAEKQQTLTDKTENVEAFKNYDEEKRTGGNYKSEEEEPKPDETSYPGGKVPHLKRFVESRRDVQRLTDVVLKPETIYSDIKLPLDINALDIVKDLSNEEIEDIVESAEADENDEKVRDDNLNKGFSTPAVVTIGNQVKTPPVTEEPVTTTKKPLFIKDPSKRLYFYAPIR